MYENPQYQFGNMMSDDILDSFGKGVGQGLNYSLTCGLCPFF